MIRRDSVARRARSDNWRFAVEKGSQKKLPATTDVKVVYHSAPAPGRQVAESDKAAENAIKKSRAVTKRRESERAALRRRQKAAKSEKAERKGRRTSRDMRRLASVLEASAAETTVETNMKAFAAETKVEKTAAKKQA